jgi:hypothetical protein
MERRRMFNATTDAQGGRKREYSCFCMLRPFPAEGFSLVPAPYTAEEIATFAKRYNLDAMPAIPVLPE